MEYWQKFNIFAIIFFAISTSFGAALVSISKILILLSFIGFLIFNLHSKANKNILPKPWTFVAIYFAIMWIILTSLWSEADSKEMVTAMLRHSRLLFIPVVYYLIPSKKVSIYVLVCLVLSHVAVVCLSFLMYFGIHLPFTQNKQPFEYAVPFSSSLEQPIMSTLVVLLLWFFRRVSANSWIKYAIYISIALCVTNVFFVMLGRTGFMLLLLAIGLIGLFEFQKKYKFLALIIPFLLGYILFNTSTRLHERTIQINEGLTKYAAGDYDTSEGQRLDYWVRSIKSIEESPVFGKGVGSWKKEYQRLGGLQPNPPSNPHNQFLLWWVEGGFIGLIFLLAIFASLCRDARYLSQQQSRALISITALALVMSLFNCPFYGVGMGEFFMVIFGLLLATEKDSQANMQLSIIQPH